jgi:hypothetical protein
MNREKKQFLLWTSIAGILFIIVGAHDLYFLTEVDKSGFVIGLELTAGIFFVLNALIQAKKGRTR